ncbi:hypothetical protein TNCV_2697691 [Trichonephila clavipes]|nr:hypothetical protein TNCV_2697691 [Trichonephila clavipes]
MISGASQWRSVGEDLLHREPDGLRLTGGEKVLEFRHSIRLNPRPLFLSGYGRKLVSDVTWVRVLLTRRGKGLMHVKSLETQSLHVGVE